jgi:DNA-binding MarR family transcriptional regulator
MAAMRRSTPDPSRAWQLLVKFFFAQREHLPAGGEAFELSPVQCHVLHLIEPERPMAMGRLAETLGCDASNITGLIDRLEDRGLVQRRPSPEDRRIKVIQLTPTGSRVRTQLLRHVTSSARPLSRLSAADQRALIRILERLVDEQ